MTRTKMLLAIAVGSAVLSAGCFAAAYTMADADKDKSGATTSREFAWDGSSSLTLDMPAIVTYIQGGQPPGKIVVQGGQKSVSTVKVSEGRVYDQTIHSGDPVVLTITAPSIKSFFLNGRSRLTIQQYDQSTLSVRTQGSAEVEATGRAQHVEVVMQGSASTNLSGLAADTVVSNIGGTTTLVAKPAVKAELEVRNLASVVLLTRPADVKTNLIDSGRVIYTTNKE